MKPGEKIVFPFRAGAHFSRFIVKFRNTVDIEEVKTVLNTFEKDALLLTLIPIAFDDDLETQVQVNSLFVDKENSLSTIWNSFSFHSDITEFRLAGTKSHTMFF